MAVDQFVVIEDYIGTEGAPYPNLKSFVSNVQKQISKTSCLTAA
jgi:hypothetical protein